VSTATCDPRARDGLECPGRTGALTRIPEIIVVTHNTERDASGTPAPRSALTRWAIVAIPILAVVVLPAPPAVTPPAWRMLGIFAATIIGVIAQPVPMGAVVLTGLTAAVFAGVVTIEKALSGWANPLV